MYKELNTNIEVIVDEYIDDNTIRWHFKPITKGEEIEKWINIKKIVEEEVIEVLNPDFDTDNLLFPIWDSRLDE